MFLFGSKKSCNMESTCLDDCYFYYYSSCVKGSDCPYRHCEAALGTETVCTLWREGICYRANCKFRHMESRINRSSIPCFWENQPGGCRKPHCVFFHHRDRSNLSVLSETEGLILPVSSQPVSPSKAANTSTDKRESSESNSLSPSHPIQPVVVSLGEGEESDTESATSTPNKISSSLGKKISSPLKNVSVQGTNAVSSDMDLGIKTLEQIRMEKIHRESEHFYNPGQSDVTDVDASAECAILETMYAESNGYYSQEYQTNEVNEITPMDLGMESYQTASLCPLEMTSVSQRCSKSSESSVGDLRHILKKKRNVPEKEKLAKEPCTKRIISLKKSAAVSEDISDIVVGVKTQSRYEDDIGFRVKTLDEIRREKEKRQGLGGKIMAEIPDVENVAKPITNSAYQVKEESVETKVRSDTENPIVKLSCQVKGQSVENKVKPNVDHPLLKILHHVKEQSVENKVKPEGSKRKLRRKPLELYKPALKERNDMEDNERMLKNYANQMAEDSMSDAEDAAKSISQEIIPHREVKPSSYSLKRACDSDEPVTSKIRKTVELQETPLQNLSASGTGEEKPLVVAKDTSQKNDDSVTFKRRNIIRRKNLSDLSGSQPSVMDEDFNNQLQNSDSQKELSLQTAELNVSNQNGTCMEAEDLNEKAEGNEMLKEKPNNVALSPSVPVKFEDEKVLSTPSAVDELDALLLGPESDICIDETIGSSVPKAEDLFLEFEKIIQS